MEEIYAEYLTWFMRSAITGIVPVGIDRLLDHCICIDEMDSYIKAYYIQVIRPSESRNGKMALWIMEESAVPEFDDSMEIIGVHYTSYKRI